ncbi:MAG: hypothetical protein J5928_02045 [Firmicutes bacterium]|nr:hypothetical protein [Bacillota bacterium]
MKRLLSTMLILIMIMVSATSVSTAAETPKDSGEVAVFEEYVSKELGGTFTRIITDGVVTVVWEPFYNAEDTFTISKHISNTMGLSIMQKSNPGVSVQGVYVTRASWGPWQYFNERVYTGGLGVAATAAVIAAVAPWVGLRVIAAIISVGATSDWYDISGRIRYKSDNTYFYYERYTNIQKDNGNYVLSNFYDSRRTLL